jgi:hypothetical protein
MLCILDSNRIQARIHESFKFNGCRTNLLCLKLSLKSSEHILLEYPIAHSKDFQLLLIPIGRPRMIRILCQEKTGNHGLRHMEYRGCKEHNAIKIVSTEKGIKIHHTLTSLEYKEENGTFLKRKVVQEGTSRWRVKVSNHLIYMHLLLRRQKQDCCQ